MQIEFSDLSPNQAYFTMSQAIIPRPIAWVLSDNGSTDGKNAYNLAPYSFFTAVCSEPPLLMMSVGKKDEETEKDTRVNIRERKKFVVHIASPESLNELNQSAATLPHGESEIDNLGLELAEIEGFDLPRLASCKIAIACELYQMDEIGDAQQVVIYGRMISMYVDDELIMPSDKGRTLIDPIKLDPLARLSQSLYSALGNTMKADRPK